MDELKELAAAKQGSIHCLTIVGQIEGHQILPEDTKATKYEHILPLLAAIEESEEIRGLLILLNTMGGDVEAGLAIAEMIAGMKTPTVSLVLGGGHSIGVIVRFVTEHSRITREDYLRLMTNTDELANDVGSVINGEEAVRLGLIDRLGSLSDALQWLHERE